MITGYAQSPHGVQFQINCADCHNTDGWAVEPDQMVFDHGSTGFALSGQHQEISCIDCHQSLQFNQVGQECVDCHIDMHQSVLGNDCTRCHDTNNWLVDNIPQIHLENGFPLLGAHAELACIDCHTTADNQEYTRLGNDCINCHLADYQSAEPDHVQLGYSQTCVECHALEAYDWTASSIDHSFFPLEGSHALSCEECHLPNTFSGLSTDCFSCHESDYLSAAQPNHVGQGFPTDCVLCHTLEPDWQPADFSLHDAEYFPIYSGTHRGEWDSCTDCHIQSGNYQVFSCIDCHEHSNQSRMAREHDEVRAYVFESNACYSCHPTGEED